MGPTVVQAAIDRLSLRQTSRARRHLHHGWATSSAAGSTARLSVFSSSWVRRATARINPELGPSPGGAMCEETVLTTPPPSISCTTRNACGGLNVYGVIDQARRHGPLDPARSDLQEACDANTPRATMLFGIVLTKPFTSMVGTSTDPDNSLSALGGNDAPQAARDNIVTASIPVTNVCIYAPKRIPRLISKWA